MDLLSKINTYHPYSWSSICICFPATYPRDGAKVWFTLPYRTWPATTKTVFICSNLIPYSNVSTLNMRWQSTWLSTPLLVRAMSIPCLVVILPSFIYYIFLASPSLFSSIRVYKYFPQPHPNLIWFYSHPGSYWTGHLIRRDSRKRHRCPKAQVLAPAKEGTGSVKSIKVLPSTLTTARVLVHVKC